MPRNTAGANGQQLLPLLPALPPASLQHPHWVHRGLARQAVGRENHAKMHTFLLCPAAFSSPSKQTEKTITQKIKMEKTEITAAFTIAKIMQWKYLLDNGICQHQLKKIAYCVIILRNQLPVQTGSA